MNCKPGNAAFVIKQTDTFANHLCDGTRHELVPIGHPVKVTKLYFNKGVPTWTLEKPINFSLSFPCGCCASGSVIGIADCFLKPIDNPGDDAVDESHAWLPPVPQEVTA